MGLVQQQLDLLQLLLQLLDLGVVGGRHIVVLIVRQVVHHLQLIGGGGRGVIGHDVHAVAGDGAVVHVAGPLHQHHIGAGAVLGQDVAADDVVRQVVFLGPGILQPLVV